MEWDFLVHIYLGFALPLATSVVGLFFLKRSAADEERPIGYGSALLITIMGLLLFAVNLPAYTRIPAIPLNFELIFVLPVAMPFAITLFVAAAPYDDTLREAFGIAILLGWVFGLNLIFS